MIKEFIKKLKKFRKSWMKRRVLPLLLINKLLLPINWLKRIGLSLKIILIVMSLLLEETQENFPEQLKLQKV